MSGARRVIYKIGLLANLSVLVLGGIMNHLANVTRSGISRFFRNIAPTVRTDTGLLVDTYELMRKRLRDALQEIEQKNRQLEEYGSQLRGSVDFLQNIIDGLDEELMVLDSQSRIIHANRNVSSKHENQEVVGRYCYEVTHGSSHLCDSNSCTCPADKVWQTGTPSRVIHVHSNGTNGSNKERYIEVNALPLYGRTGKITHVMELARDITEGKELEKRITEANRYLLALNTIANTISQTLNIDAILNNALDKIIELTKADAGGVLLLDEESQMLSYKVHRGLSEQFVQGIAGLTLGEGIAGRAAERRETLVVEDISNDPRVTRPVVSEEGLAAFVSVPLLSKEKVIGVLNIANRKPRPFPEQEIHLLNAISNQLGIAIENARLYHELQLKDQIRADLLRQIILTQEDERRRVARELHDVTSQALATLAARLESLSATLGPNLKEAEAKLQGMKALLSATSKEVHRLIYDLRPSQLDDLGLPAALRSCAYDCLESAGIEVHMEIVGQEKRLPPEAEITIFRIAQEAIANVAHHAQAESVFISLEFKENAVALQVEDDGIGFDLSQQLGSADTERHMGLLGMKERADLIGGTLTIDTKPSRGTKVAVEIPMEAEQDDG
jgi:signal transduction histidine kinase/PAS domain-containing protein